MNVIRRAVGKIKRKITDRTVVAPAPPIKPSRAEIELKDIAKNIRQSNKVLIRMLDANRDAGVAAIEMLRLQYLTLHKDRAIKPLACFSESSFSQNGEDGVIAEIFRRLDRPCRSFVEIGGGDGTENNTIARLLAGASGMWVEAGEQEAASVKTHHANAIDNKTLRLVAQRITAENVNELIRPILSPDLISIDIDGNDYWVWKAIEAKPALFIIEYNGTYGSSLSWAMKYNPEHVWKGGNAYYGASLKALEKLGIEKGYALVGVDFMGVNAFFVRNDLVGDKFPGPHTSEVMFEPFRRGIASMIKGKQPTFGPYVNP